MSDIAIKVEHLSKQYRIGERESYKALRDVIADAAAAPFRRVKSAFNGNGSANGSSLSTHDSSGEVRNSKSEIRNSIWALDDVSFEVKQGEVVGIIGRNGAGKSTLLKILSRITKPTKGHAKIFGRVGSLLEVGTGFHPELTGRENIYLNGAILGMRKAEIERKFDEIVAFAEVEKFIDTPVKRYSSGMYVRLAFAVAAHMETEVLLVDEVLAVGDAEFQKKCLGKIDQVAHGGRTVLFVSHNMGTIRELCTDVIWITEGKIVNAGPSGPLVERYLATTMKESDSNVDLDTHRRNADSGKRLRILSVRFNDGTPIFHGEMLKVQIKYQTFSDVDGVAFGLGFSSFEGTRMMTIDSDLLKAQTNVHANTVGTVEAELSTLQLQPGRYSLDVGARSGANSSLDYLPACAQVEVLPGPDTPAMMIQNSGGVRVPALWRWQELSQSEVSSTAKT